MVKEADALAGAGYEVTVIYAYWNDWGTRFDKELIASKKWRAIRAGGGPEQKKLTYILSRLLYKTARMINQRSGNKYLADLSVARAAWFLTMQAKKHKADLYIAHNLGALPAAVKAAKAYHKPCGFDAEDFHRYEFSNDLSTADARFKADIEQRYIPQTTYLTASSQPIAHAYRRLFTDKEPVVILNAFPVDDEVKEPAANLVAPLKLLWFSQTIGANRGLEDVINALQLLKAYPFELHLLGNCTDETKATFNIGEIDIHFHEPMPADDLAVFSSQFDIGLALEPGFSKNNDMALSNKIFTYLQAGLCIAASDTTAQAAFLIQYPAIGKVYPKGDARALANTLLYYHQHRDQLLETRRAAYTLARREHNWETEAGKLLTLIKNILVNFEQEPQRFK